MNDHHNHPHLLLHKLSSVDWLLYQSHLDLSSSNVSHPFHPDHVSTLIADFNHTIDHGFSGDIIIERWVPYGAQAKRRTIVQRAAAAQQYQAPRNVIIQYEPVQVRIVRQFQRLGVTQYNPQAYLQQYGASLLDAATLLQQARSAGVVEDIVSSFIFVFLPIHFSSLSSHHQLLVELPLASALLHMVKKLPSEVPVLLMLALLLVLVVVSVVHPHTNHQAFHQVDSVVMLV